MCGGCGQRGSVDWLSLAVRTRTQRTSIAAALDRLIPSARISVTASGWMITSLTGRSLLAHTMSELWSAVHAFEKSEPDWVAVLAAPISPGPIPALDRRTVCHLDVSDYNRARRHLDEITSEPEVHRVRVGTISGHEVYDGEGLLGVLLAERVPSLTLAALLVSGLLEYGRGNGRILECTAACDDGEVHLLSWDGIGLSCVATTQAE